MEEEIEEIEIPYKQLSKFDKFSEFKDVNFCREERHHAAIYLKALWLNDVDTLNEFEKFGDRVFSFMLNKRAYDNNVSFGYTYIAFDENGWLIEPKFEPVETILFEIKKSNCRNKIEISKTVNGKWIIGISCNANSSGFGSGLNLWGEAYETQKDAKIDGLNKMIEWHKTTNEAISNTVIKLATDKLNELSDIGQLQLTI